MDSSNNSNPSWQMALVLLLLLSADLFLHKRRGSLLPQEVQKPHFFSENPLAFWYTTSMGWEVTKGFVKIFGQLESE